MQDHARNCFPSAAVCFWLVSAGGTAGGGYCMNGQEVGVRHQMTVTVLSGKHSQQDCYISMFAFERSCACAHFKHNQSQCIKV